MSKSYGQISSFPYSESFENTFGAWTGSADDDMDWVNYNAAAPSGGTGPDAASAGSYYMYTEASAVGATNAVVDGYPNKRAYLEAVFDFTGEFNPKLTFDYHMYGATIGTLYVDVNDGSWNNGVWSLSGQQQTSGADAWIQVTVDLSAYENRNNITIRFRGVTGTDYTGDMAIDNISVCTVNPGTATVSSAARCSAGTVDLSLSGHDVSASIQWQQSTDNVTFSNIGVDAVGNDAETTGTLSTGNSYYFRAAVTNAGCTNYSNVVTTVVEAANGTVSSFPYLEDFETDFGSWTNPAVGDDFDWSRLTTSTPSNETGPLTAAGGSAYIYTEASGTFNSEAFLEVSFDFTSINDPQLVFDYHMFGSDMGTLSVDVATDQDVWIKTGQQQAGESVEWDRAYVDLSNYAGLCSVTIRFHGLTGANYRSDMALDNILVWDACPSVSGGTASISETLLCAAGTVDLSVVGQDGGATLQWQQSTDNINFSDIGGATSANYTTASLSTGSTYFFRAELDNVCINYSDTVSVVVNAGGGGISTFPYSENLDVDLGDWTNATDDDFDWTLNTGTTTSNNTGPSAGNGGAGQYIYTEATGNTPGQIAHLETDFDFTGVTSPILSFYYHMYGGDMGTIFVDANGTNIGSVAFEQQTADTDAWELASFDLSAYANACNVTIRLRGVTGDDYRSDMSIDDISVCAVSPGTASISENSLCAAGAVNLSLADYDDSATIQWEESTDGVTYSNLSGGTNANATTGTLSTGNTYYYRAAVTDGCTNYSNVVSVVVTSGSGYSTFPYSESFDSGLGIWTQSASDDFDWELDTNGTDSDGTGPSGPYSGSQYIVVDATDGNPSKNAYLEAEFDFTSMTAPELSFFYHMYGTYMGTFYVEVNGVEVWSKTGQQQTDELDPWTQVTIDLSAYEGSCGVTIRFRALTGGNFQSDIALDDISLCGKPQTSAITGNADVCKGDTGISYSVDNNAGNTYDWFISGGSASPSSSTNSVDVDWGSTGMVGSISVRETSGDCQGDLVNLDVNIHTLPTSSISGDISVPVSTQDQVYSVDNNSGYTYAWTINGGSADPASTSNSVNIDWDGTAETVSLSVIATDAGRGCTAASSVNVNITKYDIITSNGSGPWNNTGSWSCGCIPLATENVQILNGHVITLAQNETINNIIIDAGGEVANSTFTLTVDGDYTINGIHSGTGNIDLAGTDAEIDGTGDITTTGDLQISGGNKTILSTANIDVSGDVDITAGGITVTNNGTMTITGNLDAFNGTNNWTNTATSALNVSGTLLSNGSLSASASGNTVTYGVAGNQTIKIPNGSQYYNLVLSNSGTKDLTGNIIVQNNLTISDAATLDATASNYDINIYGNWTNTSSGGFTPNSGAVNFIGTSGDQTIANTSDETFYDMSVNKSTGDVLLTATTDLIITNSLTLTDGLITPASNETVTFNSGATATSTTVSYINGRAIKIGSDDFIFPIGKGKRGRIGISGVTSSTFEAEYFDSEPSNRSNLSGLNHVSRLEYWDLDRPSGTGSISVTLYWDSGAKASAGGSDITDISGGDLVVAHYTAGNWTNAGGATSGTAASGSVTGTASSFSPFTFGSVSGDNPLPVDLLYFNAELTETGHVQLEWETATEINNDRFEVERSADGVHFEVIGIVAGNGTTNVPQLYHYRDDNPYFGISYYRITQIDYDGTFETFEAKKIDNDLLLKGINTAVYPNPTEANNINVRLESGDETSPVRVQIYDVMGQVVYDEYFEARIGTNELDLHQRRQMTPGIYTVIVQQANNRRNHKLVIR